MQPELEILISTMERDNLDWLRRMFPGGYDNLHLLIVNQSEHGRRIDESLLPSRIRVINLPGKGLSRSRNVALENAVGRFLLLADDDGEYFPGFEQNVIRAHRRWDEPVIIFPFLNETGRPWGDHRSQSYLMQRVEHIYSPQISFKKEFWTSSDLRFNENFGLGTSLPDGENYILFSLMKRRGIPIRYAGGDPIGRHPEVNSSFYIQRPGNIKARLAAYKYLYGAAVYPYFAKLMFFLLRKRMIRPGEIPHYAHWLLHWAPGREAEASEN